LYFQVRNGRANTLFFKIGAKIIVRDTLPTHWFRKRIEPVSHQSGSRQYSGGWELSEMSFFPKMTFLHPRRATFGAHK
jgi:hypothetical protein